MKVLEVERILDDSVRITNVQDLDKIIELPLLESCKIFYELGVRTVMSSCNKYNVLSKDKPRNKNISFKDRISRDWSFANGYAWILLDFTSMSSENQKYVLSLCDENNFSLVDKLPENGKKAFVDLCKLNGTIPTNEELIEFATIPAASVGYAPEVLERNDNHNPRPDDPIYVEFYKKKHTLFLYPYVTRGVLFRYPLNDETTVEEVSNYFVELANTFSDQKGNANGFRVIKHGK